MIKKIAVLFPGQGSQYVGMGKTLCENYHVAKDIFKQADDILHMNLSQICFNGPIRDLSSFSNTLLAVFVMNIAAYKVFEETYELTPMMGAGHSLGEFSALVCSGIVDFEAMLKLVQYRCNLVAEQNKNGRMAIINDCEKEYLEDICARYSSKYEPVSIACYNSASQFAIAGHNKGIVEIEKVLKKEHVKITPLLNSPPLHSPMMNIIVDVFKETALKLSLAQFRWPVLANCDAKEYTAEKGIADKLSKQLIKPVLWTDCISHMIDAGADVLLEIGPQSILTEINRYNDLQLPSYSFLQKNDKDNFEKYITQKKSFGRNYNITIITKCLSAAVSIKNNNPDMSEYQAEVIEPYHKVRQLQNEIQKYNKIPTKEQEEQALEMLKCVLKGKRVSPSESKKIMSDILNFRSKDKL